jgi:hypothetical protein
MGPKTSFPEQSPAAVALVGKMTTSASLLVGRKSRAPIGKAVPVAVVLVRGVLLKGIGTRGYAEGIGVRGIHVPGAGAC